MPAVKIRPHYVASDERTNTVLVTGPPDKIAQAREIVKRIDVANPPDQLPVVKGPPQLKTYTVQTGNAEVIAKQLQEHYKNAPAVRVRATGPNAIVVLAPPDDKVDIATLIGGQPRKGNE